MDFQSSMMVLRARLADRLEREQASAAAEDRRSQVGTGDRSERIRTYNFNEGRITDHRIGKTVYNVNSFIDGEIDVILDALQEAAQNDQLNQSVTA